MKWTLIVVLSRASENDLWKKYMVDPLFDYTNSEVIKDNHIILAHDYPLIVCFYPTKLIQEFWSFVYGNSRLLYLCKCPLETHLIS